jgi:hypothetical protein
VNKELEELIMTKHFDANDGQRSEIMGHPLSPEVGHWYRNVDEHYDFEVVALDEEAGTIEIQFFDGELQELDEDDWVSIDLISIEEPGDWSGAYEQNREDLDLSETGARPENWSGIFTDIEPED